ncbi:PREDICTED: uncharacterized protein LOC109224288 [Nicotiana attenuata]|uniref:uncharacterized protein LOC109224288 n=1 Tax=Nicotiana attenuata TaxID=49451 RepID=UPI000905C2D3|nr:PREDICTED: uncharacterized protein LOC109224288 [Nicotiana attenuata]
MTWIIWNIKGINKRYKQKELKQYLKENHIKIAGLLETRVKENKAPQNANKIVPGWERISNYRDARNGRIRVVWDAKAYNIQQLASASQFVHCMVTGRLNGIDHILTWGFNAILHPNDRLSGISVSLAELKNFSECFNKLLLNKVSWKGKYYTWTNKQRGNDRVCSRIDRAIANDEWMLQYGSLTAVYGEPFISDHTLILILMREARRNIKVPFRLFDVRIEHPSFKQIVEIEWGKNKAIARMKNIWLKLKGLKPTLKQLNIEEFKGIIEKMSQARLNLKRIQEELGDTYFDALSDQEKNYLIQLEKWSLIEESALQQKSRATWIKLGDSNTKYFSAVMKEKQHKKQIIEIKSLLGVNSGS